MADRLPTNIDPQDITIDNAGSYAETTSDTVDEIENVDLARFESNLENLEHIFDTGMRVFSPTQPTGIKGMAWFKQS